jgi:Kef-type K+ transport system membrane component KefB
MLPGRRATGQPQACTLRTVTHAMVVVLLLGGAGAAAAASAEGAAAAGPVLFGLAVLVLLAKLGGLAMERLGQPSVLGELAVGIGLGNLMPLLFAAQGIAFVRGNETLHVLAEVGVLILLFDVGLEADLRAFAAVGRSSVLVALIGVVVPFALGWGAAAWFLPDTSPLVHVFIGATLTATSVGITARVLQDLGATRSREGQTVLGAAILDDVLGLIVLAVVSGLAAGAAADRSVVGDVAIIVVKAALFLGLTIAAGHYLSHRIIRLVARTGHPSWLVVVGLALCFSLAYAAERIGLAGIIGAFAAGLLLDPYGVGVRTKEDTATLSELLEPMSELFVPLFFVLMGIQVHLASLADPAALGFGAVLVACAIAGKLVTAFGVLERDTNRWAVAIGMVPRGEVGLIFAGIGAALMVGGAPILSQATYSAVVLMVLVTTLVTPPGLRWTLAGRAR